MNVINWKDHVEFYTLFGSLGHLFLPKQRDEILDSLNSKKHLKHYD